VKQISGKEKALIIAEAAAEKKANDPVVLDVRSATNLCDYFVICSAETSTQLRAIHKNIQRKSAQYKLDIHHSEQDEEPQWILVDCFDVVVHIFLDEARSFYNLENLWSTAKQVKLTERRKMKKKSENH
jgi:ribosome-associated protein